ncbi:hypothetical protein BCR42DRAFT_144327 [Absidia repens]|uniref:SEP domain-containing protein n=1 Tax=Absidia repens TaxID=90262 RepID=A0A1X2I350_9FUNG|nr:hypothetical protein BCR42DRAFT_144327 [Absidia repens]
MIDQDKLMDEFIKATNVSKDQAKIYLESANWDVELAVAQHHNNGNRLTRKSIPGAASDSPYGSNVTTTPKAPMSSPSKHSSNASRSSRSSNIRTLNDVAPRDTESGNQAQNFFAGGEKSGMLVQDPSKQSKSKSLVEEILKKAAAGGSTTEGSDAERHSTPSYFTGSGHTLGSEEDPSVTVNDTAVEEDESMIPVTRHLTFWRNGYSVDDGPLLRYDDPANAAMLNAINSGRAPLSLLNVHHGQPVDVKVSKRQDEDYIPPAKAPPKPFEGSGNRLGSSSSSPSTAITTASMPPTEPFEIDASQPTTSVQIRLSDGSRLVKKFNLTHTVNDLRHYIDK